MSALCFELNRSMLDRPQMPPSAALYPGTHVPQPAPCQEPRAVTAQPIIQARGTRSVRIRWTPPVELLLQPDIGFRTCIAACLGTVETMPALENGSVMYLTWPLYDSCRTDCHNHRDHGSHLHLSGIDHHRALVLWHWWCQARADTAATPKQ